MNARDGVDGGVLTVKDNDAGVRRDGSPYFGAAFSLSLSRHSRRVAIEVLKVMLLALLLLIGAIWLVAAAVTVLARLRYGRDGPPDDGRRAHSLVQWCRAIFLFSP